MHVKNTLFDAAVLLGLVVVADASPMELKLLQVNGLSTLADFDASTATLAEFSTYALDVAKSRVANSTSGCTADNISVRKYWGDLSADARIEYTDAILCLMTKEAKTPADLAAGAKSRYDDWIVTHINMTMEVHATANFLGWHRWFIWELEQNLKTECNYTGTIPYWDWTKTAETGLEASPEFDGSATSLSGNGDHVDYDADDVIVLNANSTGQVILTHGTGGGCVTNGPFANLTVNLGPDYLAEIGGTNNQSGWKFGYDPRCLKRDLTDYSNQRYANMSSVLALLRDSPDIWTFETVMQGPSGVPELGVHGGGHYAMGGDPARDFYVSPGDPFFWSHHAMVDRVWWLWQMQSPNERAANVATAVSGPLTFYDLYEPHANGTIETLQTLGYIADWVEVALGELMSTTGGMFCYVYE